MFLLHFGRWVCDFSWAVYAFYWYSSVAFTAVLHLTRIVALLVHVLVTLRALSLGLNDFKVAIYLLQARLDKIYSHFKIFQFLQNWTLVRFMLLMSPTLLTLLTLAMLLTLLMFLHCLRRLCYLYLLCCIKWNTVYIVIFNYLYVNVLSPPPNPLLFSAIPPLRGRADWKYRRGNS